MAEETAAHASSMWLALTHPDESMPYLIYTAINILSSVAEHQCDYDDCLQAGERARDQQEALLLLSPSSVSPCSWRTGQLRRRASSCAILGNPASLPAAADLLPADKPGQQPSSSHPAVLERESLAELFV